MNEGTFDYIVVGAGSSGSPLAHRLARSGKYSVLLVEAGPTDDDWQVRLPKAFSHVCANPERAWEYKVEAMDGKGSPVEVWPRGKMLGGSSGLNGMMYMRGQRQDYDGWAASGLAGWEWENVLPAFREIENHGLGANEHRGGGGPLTVSPGHVRTRLGERVIEAGRQMGLRVAEDINDPHGEGICWYPHTIARGRRVTAAAAFLAPLKHAANLTVLTGVTVDRILFEGRRATGIAARRNGRPCRFTARREIALCGGTIETPKLLQLSGVGPAALLASHGIDLVCDSPAVGAHMLDHLSPHMQFRLAEGFGHNAELHWPRLGLTFLNYFLFGQGVLSTGGETGGLVKADPEADRADTQLMATGVSLGPPKPGSKVGTVHSHPGMTLTTCVLRPKAEGEIVIASADPDAPPRVRTNWLGHEYDRAAVVRAVRFARRLVRQPALQGVVLDEIMIGEHAQTDEQILDVFKGYIRGSNHAVGTCRMGAPGEGVVDARLRVHGIENLRVASCAAMPTTISGNTNGPAMMLGWRTGGFMLEDAEASG